MRTIIEINYKNYSENVVVTKGNEQQVLDHLMSDKSIQGFTTIQHGDYTPFQFSNLYLIESDYKVPAKVQTIFSLEDKIDTLESCYCHTDREALRTQEKIKSLCSRVAKKRASLNSAEALWV